MSNFPPLVHACLNTFIQNIILIYKTRGPGHYYINRLMHTLEAQTDRFD